MTAFGPEEKVFLYASFREQENRLASQTEPSEYTDSLMSA